MSQHCVALFLLWAAFAAPHSAAQTQSPAPPALRSVDSFDQILASRGRDSETARLERLISLFQRDAPPDTTTIDGERAVWVSWRPAKIAEQKRLTARALEAVRSINIKELPPPSKLDLLVLLNKASSDAELSRFPTEYVFLDTPVWDAYRIAELPHKSHAEYREIVAWLRGVPLAITESLQTLRAGVARGLTADQGQVTSLLEALNEVAPELPAESPYLAAFKQFPPQITSDEQRVLRTQAEGIYRSRISPAYAKYREYLRDTYMATARPYAAMSTLPEGTAWYAALVRRATGTSMSPDEIHEAGHTTVRRAHTEIAEIARGTGFSGSVGDFVTTLRRDPRCAPLDEAAVTTRFQQIREQVEAALPQLFGVIPKTPYEVKSVKSLPPAAAGAQAKAGSLKEGRPGQVLVQTPMLAGCAFVNVMLHEAMPGHLLQGHIASEATIISEFRKRQRWVAFSEGWAHYAAGLSTELGMRLEPYSRAERAVGEAMMAARAVLETGIHSKGWGRAQALAYIESTLPWAPAQRTEAEVEAAIDSHGGRLAYLLGQQAILNLRRYAEAELGPRFDIRIFHDQLLKSGGLPLDVLESETREWVAVQKQQPATH